MAWVESPLLQLQEYRELFGYAVNVPEVPEQIVSSPSIVTVGSGLTDATICFVVVAVQLPTVAVAVTVYIVEYAGLATASVSEMGLNPKLHSYVMSPVLPVAEAVSVVLPP